MPNSIPVLSDHAYQSIHIETINFHTGAEIKLNVGSWNMQDQCFSKASHVIQQFANNPYDADETQENYDMRKRAQFCKIEKNIGEDGDDIVLLQEIDFLLVEKHAHLKTDFISMLHEHGYELVLTERPTDFHFTQQPMALIFNTGKLHLLQNTPLFPTPPDARGRQKYRGYESVFTDIRSQQIVVAANLHLPYDLDYTSEIQAYQGHAVLQGVLSIMGGDTNSIPNPSLETSLGDAGIATNFSRDPDTNQLTTQETIPGHPEVVIPKAYDRFFGAAPPTCSLTTKITSRSEQVSINADGNAVFSPVAKHHISEFGIDERRSHFFKAASQGDSREKILGVFLKRVDGCHSTAHLEDEIQRIKDSPEYQMFAAEQACSTVGLGYADPVCCFAEMCEAKRRQLTGNMPEACFPMI